MGSRKRGKLDPGVVERHAGRSSATSSASVAVLIYAMGCSSGDANDFGRVQQNLEPAMLMEVPAPFGSARWYEVGDIDVMPEGTPGNPALIKAPNETLDDGNEETLAPSIGYDDLVAGKRYMLVFQEGYSDGFPTVSSNTDPDLVGLPDVEDVSPRLIEKGWSDDTGNDVGNDARIDRSGSTFALYRRFGRVSAALGCTGTMVAQSANGTFALTAAHCLYDGSGNPVWGTFEPARGNAASTGEWDIIGITRYDAWITNDCFAGSSQSDSCRRYDIAIMRLSPQTGTTYLGGMAYGWYHAWFLSGELSRYHRGYPGCGQTGAPSGCTGQRLWGDEIHTVGNFRQSERLFDHSSDTSAGHSGGPMYFTSGNSVIYGVHSGGYCSGSCNGNGNQPRVNVAVKHTEDWFNTLYDLINN